MEDRTVTVFGGTGFLGRRIAEVLARRGCTVRVAARHPERVRVGLGDVRSITVDVRDGPAVVRAVEGAGAVINAVSLYRESSSVSFGEIHVDAARRVAEAAQEHGVARLVHLSGIGSDPRSSSPYIRARGAGEIAVRDTFPPWRWFAPARCLAPAKG